MQGSKYNLIDRFIRYLRTEINSSIHTQINYQSDLETYFEYVENRLNENFTPSKDDRDLIRGYMSNLMDNGLKASSVNRKLAAIKAFYKYLLKISIIEKNPAISIRGPKQEKVLPVYVPTDDINYLIENFDTGYELKNIRDRLIISTLYETGIRRSELSGLLDKNVDLINKQIKVLGKGNKERLIPIGDLLAKKMSDWIEIRNLQIVKNSKYFFVSLKGEPMKDTEVYSVVHKALEIVPNLSRRGAHALRHSFATDMLGNGADLLSIKELMGHSSVSTTVKYTHSSFKQLQKMYNAHPRAKKKD